MLMVVSPLESKHEVLVAPDPFTLTWNVSYSAVLSYSALNERLLHPSARLLTLSAAPGVVNRLCLSSPRK